MKITHAEAADLPPAIGAEEVARLYGVGRWAIYENAAAGTLPVAPIRVGRSLRWPTALVLASLGLGPDRSPPGEETSQPPQLAVGANRSPLTPASLGGDTG